MDLIGSIRTPGKQINSLGSYRLSSIEEFMDDLELKILEAVNAVSPKSFISPVKVNAVLKSDETELGNRLNILKKSGHVDVMTSEYPSSLT